MCVDSLMHPIMLSVHLLPVRCFVTSSILFILFTGYARWPCTGNETQDMQEFFLSPLEMSRTKPFKLERTALFGLHHTGETRVPPSELNKSPLDQF